MRISVRVIVSDAEHLHERRYEAQVELPMPTNPEHAEAQVRALLDTLADRADKDLEGEDEALA